MLFLLWVFFGFEFNEYIILYCCGLEHETEDEIADRANNQFLNELYNINDSSSYTDNNDNNEYNGLGII